MVEVQNVWVRHISHIAHPQTNPLEEDADSVALRAHFLLGRITEIDSLHHVCLIESHQKDIRFVIEFLEVRETLGVLFELSFGAGIRPDDTILTALALTERGEIGLVKFERLLV